MMLIEPFIKESAFCPLLRPYRIRADHIMAIVNVFLLIVCLVLAPLHGTWLAAFAIGLPTTALGFWLSHAYSGVLLTRLFMSSAFMVFASLIIHQAAGDIEAHFASFGLIGLLLYYRDWRTIFLATIVILLHHLILGYAQTLGMPIYVFENPQEWLTYNFAHITYYTIYSGAMMYLSIWLRREGYETQNVIAIAEQIIHGRLVKEMTDNTAQETPLIHAVRAMKNHLLDLLEVLPVATAVIRLDTHQVISLNETWLYTFGHSDLKVDASIRHASIWVTPTAWDDLINRLQAAPNKLLNKVETRMRKADGSPIVGELSMVLHTNAIPAMVICTVEDITQRREAEKTMTRLAYRDLLTDLPNRASLISALKAADTDWKIHRIPYAVLMMDLDGFKPINDTYGHGAGDEVLKIIAIRLQNVSRNPDLIARLGGDEFTAILRNCTDSRFAIEVAHRITDAVSSPISLDSVHTTVHVGMSIGIIHIHDVPTEHPDILLKQADIALYAAKAAGKRCIKLFVPPAPAPRKA